MKHVIVIALLLTRPSPLSRISLAADAAALMRQCLPAPNGLSHRSRLVVEVTRKSAPAETHRFRRLETAERLFITPPSASVYGVLLQKQPPQRWFYHAVSRRLGSIADGEAPAWLASETCSMPRCRRALHWPSAARAAWVITVITRSPRRRRRPPSPIPSGTCLCKMDDGALRFDTRRLFRRRS